MATAAQIRCLLHDARRNHRRAVQQNDTESMRYFGEYIFQYQQMIEIARVDGEYRGNIWTIAGTPIEGGTHA